MIKSHQDAALDLLYKNFTTNIEDYLAWKAKWIKNRKLIYPLNQDIKGKLTPFIKKTNQAFRRYISDLSFIKDRRYFWQTFPTKREREQFVRSLRNISKAIHKMAVVSTTYGNRKVWDYGLPRKNFFLGTGVDDKDWIDMLGDIDSYATVLAKKISKAKKVNTFKPEGPLTSKSIAYLVYLALRFYNLESKNIKISKRKFIVHSMQALYPKIPNSKIMNLLDLIQSNPKYKFSYIDLKKINLKALEKSEKQFFYQ
jgi:hypothetical protein